ncbi:MAG TPA: hypothetical protein VEX13_08560 [Chloroflexia bacterium]|nr:hypothetical protein [Chloroflexia bacterium]
MATSNRVRKVSTNATQTTRDPANRATQKTPTIRKGIYLSALIYIEGDQPAPEDFTALTTTALKKRLASAFEGGQDGLTMSIRKLEVVNDVEEEDIEDDVRDEEEKFQF